ncbi:MAG: hypothetical protein WBY88_14675 [Desulfosarcina sp.]
MTPPPAADVPNPYTPILAWIERHNDRGKNDVSYFDLKADDSAVVGTCWTTFHHQVKASAAPYNDSSVFLPSWIFAFSPIAVVNYSEQGIFFTPKTEMVLGTTILLKASYVRTSGNSGQYAATTQSVRGSVAPDSTWVRGSRQMI